MIHSQHTNTFTSKQHSCVQGPLRKCLRARRFRASLLLHPTCVRSCCHWCATCVVTKKKKEPRVKPDFISTNKQTNKHTKEGAHSEDKKSGMTTREMLCDSNRGTGWKLSKNGEKQKVFMRPHSEDPLAPGRMVQTTRAGTGDFVGWFHRYEWSTPSLINYDSNLLVRGNFLIKLIPHTNNRELQKRPMIWTQVLNAVTLNNWSFCTVTVIFCTNELYNPGLLPSPHSRPTFSKGIAFGFFYDNTRLPGSLLAAQGGRQSKDFRVLHQKKKIIKEKKKKIPGTSGGT